MPPSAQDVALSVWLAHNSARDIVAKICAQIVEEKKSPRTTFHRSDLERPWGMRNELHPTFQPHRSSHLWPDMVVRALSFERADLLVCLMGAEKLLDQYKALVVNIDTFSRRNQRRLLGQLQAAMDLRVKLNAMLDIIEEDALNETELDGGLITRQVIDAEALIKRQTQQLKRPLVPAKSAHRPKSASPKISQPSTSPSIVSYNQQSLRSPVQQPSRTPASSLRRPQSASVRGVWDTSHSPMSVRSLDSFSRTHPLTDGRSAPQLRPDQASGSKSPYLIAPILKSPSRQRYGSPHNSSLADDDCSAMTPGKGVHVDTSLNHSPSVVAAATIYDTPKNVSRPHPQRVLIPSSRTAQVNMKSSLSAPNTSPSAHKSLQQLDRTAERKRVQIVEPSSSSGSDIQDSNTYMTLSYPPSSSPDSSPRARRIRPATASRTRTVVA